MPPESPQCDPQRQQVYDMEAEEFGRHAFHKATRKSMRFWNREMAVLMKVPEPPLVFGNAGTGYAGEYVDGKIRMSPRDGMCLLSLAHEFSHHVETLKRPGRPQHGPYFCRTFMVLLDAMRLVPKEGFRAAAKRHGVKIARIKRLGSDAATVASLLQSV